MMEEDELITGQLTAGQTGTWCGPDQGNPSHIIHILGTMLEPGWSHIRAKSEPYQGQTFAGSEPDLVRVLVLSQLRVTRWPHGHACKCVCVYCMYIVCVCVCAFPGPRAVKVGLHIWCLGVNRVSERRGDVHTVFVSGSYECIDSLCLIR